MLRKYNVLVRSAVFLFDFVILLTCWISTYFLRFQTNLIPQIYSPPTFAEHLRLFPYLLAAHFLVFDWMGLYQPMRLRKAQEQFIAVSQASFLAWLLFTTFIYFFMNGYHYSRISLVVFLLLNAVALFISKLIIMHILRKLRKKGYNLKHVLIVGTGEQARTAAERLFKHLEFGYSVIGFLARNKKEIGKGIFRNTRVIGSYGDLARITRTQALDQVIFCLKSKEERLIRPLLSCIDNEGVDIKIILELGDIFTLRNKAEEFDGLTILSLRENPLFGWQGLAKRIFDIFGSLSALIFFLPFMVIIAVCVKLTSKGTVFYKQQRVGMDGRKFMLYKFRSMVDKAESLSGAVFAKRSDPRVTKIGKFLRRTSLDELPQLINVLKGDLSLVGPRPERPEFVKEFYKSIPRYMLRHKIRMGMTGWAQVHGLRGDTCIKTRLQYDLDYINHWSFWLDIKIIFMTFFSVIKGEGAY
jgi:Undecaprenyl-phosphate glucose phosphotransferase